MNTFETLLGIGPFGSSGLSSKVDFFDLATDYLALFLGVGACTGSSDLSHSFISSTALGSEIDFFADLARSCFGAGDLLFLGPSVD